jgi:nucleoside-diphosphate-sugar epimerase
MNEGVRLSRNFILFLTKEVLSSEWCLKEIRKALKHRKNVILVFQTDKRYGGVPGPFSEFYGPELKKAFPNAQTTFVPDLARQGIVDSWPEDVDDSAARRDWGWTPTYTFESAFEKYLMPKIRARYGKA